MGKETNMDTQVYAGRLKNVDDLMRSSSGGAFTAISNYILKRNGAVICTVYDYDTNYAVFKLIENEEMRDAARGSKYMQSKPGNIFRTAYDWIEKHPDKELLFVGMGCQADGFRKYTEIKGIREKVIIVDIICHGAVSPKLWKEYADGFGKFDWISFKDKRNGWYKPAPVGMISDKEISIADYVKVFYTSNPLRLSCYQCPYTRISRMTDITIGDYWHIEEFFPEFYDPSGTSIFLVHSDKGKSVFEGICDEIVYCKSDITKCWQENLEKPTARPISRERFWRYYYKHGVIKTIRKYSRDPFEVKVKKLKKTVKYNIKSVIGR